MILGMPLAPAFPFMLPGEFSAELSNGSLRVHSRYAEGLLLDIVPRSSDFFFFFLVLVESCLLVTLLL